MNCPISVSLQNDFLTFSSSQIYSFYVMSAFDGSSRIVLSYLRSVWCRPYSNKIFVMPFEYNEADDRILIAFDSCVDELCEYERIGISTPGLSAVHALTLLATIHLLILQNRELRSNGGERRMLTIWSSLATTATARSARAVTLRTPPFIMLVFRAREKVVQICVWRETRARPDCCNQAHLMGKSHL